MNSGIPKTRVERLNELKELMFPKDSSLEDIAGNLLYYHTLKEVRIEAPKPLLEHWKRIDGFLLRKDGPHYNGDEYHVHGPLKGGGEVVWGVSGKRRHENKCSADVPQAMKQAVAKFLNVPTDLIETFWLGEPSDRILLVEVVQHLASR